MDYCSALPRFPRVLFRVSQNCQDKVIECLYSYICSSMDITLDSRSSFLNFKFPTSPPWNLIWEWRLTLPSFVLANRQTTVYFRTTFKLDNGLATGLHVSNNYRSYYRLILAPRAMCALPLIETYFFACEQHLETARTILEYYNYK
jgi:hypothetical protein